MAFHDWKYDERHGNEAYSFTLERADKAGQVRTTPRLGGKGAGTYAAEEGFYRLATIGRRSLAGPGKLTSTGPAPTPPDRL